MANGKVGMSGNAKATTALTALARDNVCASKDVLARCAACCACAGVCRHMDVATNVVLQGG